MVFLELLFVIHGQRQVCEGGGGGGNSREAYVLGSRSSP
jgi:hypothetical protein